jgi:cell wall assembly regulator SMI1
MATAEKLIGIGYWYNRAQTELPSPLALVDDSWSSNERRRVAEYLRAGGLFEAYRGYSHCRFPDCPIPHEQMGSRDLTDGVWVWPEGLHHYVETHAVRLPEQFVRHALSGSRPRETPGRGAPGRPSVEYESWKEWASPIAAAHTADIVRRIFPPGSARAAPPDAAKQLDDLEQRIGQRLPPDLRALHLGHSAISLCDGRYEFLAPRAMELMDSTGELCPRTWLAVVEVGGSGDLVCVDLAPNEAGMYHWLDCDHESTGEADVIATSLEQFVGRALASPNGLYWLARGHERYRRIVHENPTSYWRRIDGDWYEKLGDEAGPEPCTTEGCTRLHIAFSVKCRKHHYEMLRGRPSPFDD